MSPDCSSLEEREAALHEEDDDGDDDQEELVAGLGAHGCRRLALGPQPLQLVLTRGRSESVSTVFN